MSKKCVGAGIVLVRTTSEGPCFLLLRGTDTGVWSFPKGHAETRDRGDPLATAIRETWEETGLLIGKPGSLPVRTLDAGWTSFKAAGIAPHLSPLRFFARAITPPQRHKRFDARFFIANAEEALYDMRPARDGAEMQDLRWFSLDEAFGLDLPNVTRFILTEVQTRLQSPDQPHSPAFLRWGRTGPLVDRL
jgi:8-oxo-dGTP pyrophosphatase MutT (NUDIX family)